MRFFLFTNLFLFLNLNAMSECEWNSAALIPHDELNMLLSTNDIADIKKKIKKIYKNPSEVEFKKISHGVANKVFFIRNNLQPVAVLKYYPNNSYSQVTKIYQFVNTLTKYGIPASASDYIYETREHKAVALLSYYTGDHISVFSPEQQNEVAKIMAQIHMLNVPCEINNDLFEKFDFLFLKCENWEYTKKLKDIYNGIDKSYLKMLPRRIIHGDFSYSNLLFEKSGQLSTILDLDNVTKGYLLTDLARCQIFFGFNSKGEPDTSSIENFVKSYNTYRCLRREEILNFYIHLRLILIYAVLDSYYNVEVLQTRATTRFLESEFNNDTTELLLKKLFNISSLTYIDISNNYIYSTLSSFINPFIFFTGESGVGKTTLMQSLANYSKQYYIPKLTLTRTSRKDDNPLFFDYVTKDEYLILRDNKQLIFDTFDNNTFYGYRMENINRKDKIPLLNTSAYGFEMARNMPSICILIEGDSSNGLFLRKDAEIAKIRSKNNEIVSKKYFLNFDFRKKIDIIFFNTFGNALFLAEKLDCEIQKILEKRRKYIG